MSEVTNGNPESSGDRQNELGTAYVREAGCGIVYVINLEDTDEEQVIVELDREQLEKLHRVCGKLLGKSNFTNPTTQFNPPSNVPINAPHHWANHAVNFPPGWHMPR
jgi:hypothetical protein